MTTQPNSGGSIEPRQNQQATKAPVRQEDQAIAYLQNPALLRQIQNAIPRAGCTPERFLRCVMTSIRKTPKLAECNWKSLVGSMMELAQLGLEPGTPLGHAWLVPFGGEVQIIMGYKGLISLADRGGNISMNAEVVYEGDDFDYGLGSKPYIRHKPCEDLTQRGALKYAYSVANFPDGRQPSFKVVNRADIDAAKANSAGYQSEMRKARGRSNYKPSGPWFDNEPAMWCKTAIRRHCPFLALGTEQSRLASAVEIDEQHDRGNILSASRFDALSLPEPPPQVMADNIEQRLDAERARESEAQAAEVIDPETGEVQ